LVVARNAAEFLKKGFFVGAAVADEIEVFGFVHFLAGIVAREFALQFVEKPLLQRLLQRDGMEGKTLGIALVFDLGDQLVEEIARAAMGGKNLQPPAPSNAGISDVVEMAWIFVQGEFIEDAISAFASLGVGAAGHAVNAAAAGELEDEGGGALFLHIEFAVFRGGAFAKIIGKAFAVFEEKLGLKFVSAGNPGIIPGRFDVALEPNDSVGSGPRPADLTGFLGNLEPRAVLDPCLLEWEEERLVGRNDFGGAAHNILSARSMP